MKTRFRWVPSSSMTIQCSKIHILGSLASLLNLWEAINFFLFCKPKPFVHQTSLLILVYNMTPTLEFSINIFQRTLPKFCNVSYKILMFNICKGVMGSKVGEGDNHGRKQLTITTISSLGAYVSLP